MFPLTISCQMAAGMFLSLSDSSLLGLSSRLVVITCVDCFHLHLASHLYLNHDWSNFLALCQDISFCSSFFLLVILLLLMSFWTFDLLLFWTFFILGFVCGQWITLMKMSKGISPILDLLLSELHGMDATRFGKHSSGILDNI